MTGKLRADAGSPLPEGIRGHGGGPPGGIGRPPGGAPDASPAGAPAGSGRASALATAGEWLVALVDGRLVRIDPETLTVLGESSLPRSFASRTGVWRMFYKSFLESEIDLRGR